MKRFQSLLLLTFLILVIHSRTAVGQLSAVPVNPRVVTLQKDTLTLFRRSYPKSLVIFANNYCCLQCFGELAEGLKSMVIDTSKIEILVLGRPGPSSQMRRELFEFMSPIFPAARIVFDLQEEPDPFPPLHLSGIFGDFGITRTPSVMVWDNVVNKRLALVQYGQLMDRKGLEISSKASEILARALQGN